MTAPTALSQALFLAQQVTVEPLPPGPALERWLFESPVTTGVFCLGVALVALFALRRAGKAKAGLGVLGAAVLVAAGVYIASELVETPREAVRADTRAFASAMTAGDESGVRALLSDAFVLAAGGEFFDNEDADRVAGLAPKVGQRVQSHRIRGLSASANGTNVAKTRFDLTVSAGGTPFVSGWEFSWRRSGDEWLLIRAECLHLWNKAPGRRFGDGLRGL